jgi:hypothetical protein
VVEVSRQNTDYDPLKRQQENQTIYNYSRPFQSLQEELVHIQLATAASTVADVIKPPIPNIGKTPNRFGYDRTPPGIADILVVDDSFAANFGDYGGTESGYMGTSYPQNPSINT